MIWQSQGAGRLDRNASENDDGTASLSWKKPSHVFAPYREEAGEELEVIARELDDIFEAIGREATQR